MTLLRDDPIGARDVHVLIIGVGNYDGDRHEPLAGVGLTVRRLAAWWLQSQSVLLPAGGGITVDVCLSEAENSNRTQPCLPDSKGKLVDVEPAKYENVKAAFRRWAARPGEMAVLHWIGHAEVINESDDSPIQTLYCQDEASSGGQQGFAWNPTRRAIRGHQQASKTLCFIDACRTVRDSAEAGGYVHPWNNIPKGRKPQPCVYHATQDGDAAWCVEESVNVGDEFNGGALFSEAVRLGLSSFGSERRSANGSMVYLGGLFDAISAKLKRWSRTTHALRHLTLEPNMESGGWRPDQPIVRIDQPKGMIDVRLDRSLDGFGAGACVFTSGTTPPRRCAATRTERIWACDLDHGDWTADLTLPGWKRGQRKRNYRLYQPYYEDYVS